MCPETDLAGFVKNGGISDLPELKSGRTVVMVEMLVCQEYEGLTNKIHDLQMREQQLHEVLFDNQHAATATTSDTGGLMISDMAGQPGSMSPGAELPHPAGLEDDSSASSSSRTPMRGIVKAYLPKKMTTSVSVRCLPRRPA